ncbi:MAG: amidohydrolase family protein [Vitreoscilla sp.]|nr:amidohydrolase family protein [Polaromonas sp.]
MFNPTDTNPPDQLINARLPRWLLASDWPTKNGQPELADIHIANGLIVNIQPSIKPSTNANTPSWDVAGALVLPALVDAHTHLDKTFTLRRMGAVEPGLLGAIAAMMQDRSNWTPLDVEQRATQALQWAYEAGVNHLRTHCDWWEVDATPIAWDVLGELADAWRDKLVLERVSLMPLHLFADSSTAAALAAKIAASGPGARLGGFVHTTNWNAQALRHLLEAAAHHGLNVDLHMDEELNPSACGLATTAALVKDMAFAGHVVCGHNCALSAQDESKALATLDAVAQANITLVTLPMTNLLLQDAVAGKTPKLRGITLVKEAKARGINVLMASDNVQDPFCHVGSYDPLEAFAAGVLAGQLEAPFDVWSESLCRADWLRGGPAAPPLQPGSAADLLIFKNSSAWSFPSRTHERVVLRKGQVISRKESTL